MIETHTHRAWNPPWRIWRGTGGCLAESCRSWSWTSTQQREGLAGNCTLWKRSSGRNSWWKEAGNRQRVRRRETQDVVFPIIVQHICIVLVSQHKTLLNIVTVPISDLFCCFTFRSSSKSIMWTTGVNRTPALRATKSQATTALILSSHIKGKVKTHRDNRNEHAQGTVSPQHELSN